MMMGQLSKW